MSRFFSGVIEGFYGRPWTWLTRRQWADFLKTGDYSLYVYAPKSDVYLRAQWQKPWPEAEYEELRALAEYCHLAGVEMGVGFSPLGLFRDYNLNNKTLLLKKIEQINHLNLDCLCILFDDMPGEFPCLAHEQLAIIGDIVMASNAKRFVVCPTYYSLDPVLESVFGAMPNNYLGELAEGLPSEIDIFWTGDRVISETYTESSLAEATKLLGRKPVIWDNGLANDGRATADFLRLRPLLSRNMLASPYVRGHMINPMSQPLLSMWALAGMSAMGVEQRQLVSSDLQSRLEVDADLFTLQGRLAFDQRHRRSLVEQYRAFQEPLADEVVSWLLGDYVFDPACLTS